MAEITPTGITATELGDFVEDLEGVFRSALGDDLSLEAATPQGQIIGALALVLTQVDELAIHVANGMNLYTAANSQLGDYGTLFSLPRTVGQMSTVTATLSGTPNTIVPAGSRARTSAGAVFATTEQVIIGGSRSVDVLMRAVEFGPLVAAIGALDMIVDALPGWTGVTNAAAAELGRDIESDAEYRRRYGNQVAIHARDGLEAIRSRVLSTANVVECHVRDNSSTVDETIQSVLINARSILVIVQGGADADVAAAIAATKPIGVPTIGDQLVQVPHAQGFNIPIRFRRVIPVPIQIAVNLTALTGFPSDGFAVMRANLLHWFSGTWPVPGPGIFDQSGVGIGEALDLERLNTPLNAVPGHRLNSVVVTRVQGDAALGTPNLDQRFTLESGNITFTLTPA